MELGFASAFGIGLAGAGHCLGMCGGIAAALNLGARRSLPTTLAYHGGRMASYTLLGAGLGLAAGSVDVAGWTVGLRYAAGLLLIAMGLYIADWWHGLQWLERGGALLWRPLQRIGGRLLPVRHWYQGMLLGLLWGFMPCGLIYSALAWSAAAADAATSAMLMFCFGLGTLPAMLTTSLGADRVQALLRSRGLKILIALMLIGGGAWTLYHTASHAGHSGQGNGQMDSRQPHDHPM